MGRQKFAGLLILFTFLFSTTIVFAEDIELPFDYFNSRWVEGHQLGGDGSYNNDHEWHSNQLEYAYTSNSLLSGLTLKKQFAGTRFGESIKMNTPSFFLKYRPSSKLQLNFDSYTYSEVSNVDYSETDLTLSVNYISSGSIKIKDHHAAYSYLVKPFLPKGTMKVSVHAYRGRLSSPTGWRPVSLIPFPQFNPVDSYSNRNSVRHYTQANINELVAGGTQYDRESDGAFGYDGYTNTAFDFGSLDVGVNFINYEQMGRLLRSLLIRTQGYDPLWNDIHGHDNQKQNIVVSSLSYGMSKGLNFQANIQAARLQRTYSDKGDFFVTNDTGLVVDTLDMYVDADLSRIQPEFSLGLLGSISNKFYWSVTGNQIYREDDRTVETYFDSDSTLPQLNYIFSGGTLDGSLDRYSTSLNFSFWLISQGQFNQHLLLDDYSNFYHQMLAKGQSILNLDVTYKESEDITERKFVLYGASGLGKRFMLLAGVKLNHINDNHPPERSYLSDFELYSDPLWNAYVSTLGWNSLFNVAVKYRSYDYQQGENSGWETDNRADIIFGFPLKAAQFYLSAKITMHPKLNPVSLREYPGINRNFAENIMHPNNNPSRPIQSTLAFEIGLGKRIELMLSDDRVLNNSGVDDAISKIALSKRFNNKAIVNISYNARQLIKTHNLLSAGISILL